jgi:DNA segregation ATPase FtsK/SpoIIIE-like protein
MAKEISVSIGYDESGENYSLPLSCGHVLVGGCTGSGKSVLLHNIVLNTMFAHTADEIDIYIADPKIVEFSIYNRAPQLRESATSTEEICEMLKSLVDLLMARFRTLATCEDEFGAPVNSVYSKTIFDLSLDQIC